jgi:hypothetical protein
MRCRVCRADLAYFLLRVLLRRGWLAALVFTMLGALPTLLGSVRPIVSGPLAAVQFGLVIVVLSRFGVLPLIAGVFVSSVGGSFPLTTTVARALR